MNIRFLVWTWLVMLIPLCYADINGNGWVDAADLAFILGEWGQLNGIGDIDGDGVVGPADLAALLVNWGECQN